LEDKCYKETETQKLPMSRKT